MIPEAVRELIRYGFETLHMEKLWCGYFDGNIKSKRAQEKCGFRYHHTNENIHWALMDDIRTEHVTCITREEWMKKCSLWWHVKSQFFNMTQGVILCVV